MATLYVEYCTRTKLSCTNAANQDVILCLEDAALVAPADCPAPSNGTYDGAFMPATICQWYSTGDCGTGWYVYTFSYDDALLADGSVPLQKADITGVFCKDCLVSYLEYKAGSEAYIRTEEDETQTFVSQHGCEYPIVAGGGDCVTEVTTAELNAAISGSTLVPGCTYIITDHVQGRLVAGTQVVVTALSVNQVSSACSVLSTYDDRPWRGVYDTATNTLVEVADNQGNICRQFTQFNEFSTPLSVNNFDWGNVYITNCLVDNSTWSLDYGVAPEFGINNVRITGNSELDLTDWTGTYVESLEVSHESKVDLSSSNMEIEDVIATNYGFIIFNAVSPSLNSFLFGVRCETSFITAEQNSTSELYMEGCLVQGYSGVYHNVPGYLSLFSVALTAFGEVRTGAYTTPPMAGSISDCYIDNCNISGSRNGAPLSGRISGIHITGVNTADIFIEQVDIKANSMLNVNAATSNISVRNSSVETFGILNISGTGSIQHTKVCQGILNNSGYNLTAVYLMGESTKTCTANNTNTGKDYFNDNIV